MQIDVIGNNENNRLYIVWIGRKKESIYLKYFNTSSKLQKALVNKNSFLGGLDIQKELGSIKIKIENEYRQKLIDNKKNKASINIKHKQKIKKSKKQKSKGIKKQRKFRIDKNKTYKENYLDYLKSSLWRVIRKQILKRDKKTCQHCGSHKNLNVHHITYENLFKEQPSDLITLCRECHKIEHAILKQHKNEHNHAI